MEGHDLTYDIYENHEGLSPGLFPRDAPISRFSSLSNALVTSRASHEEWEDVDVGHPPKGKQDVGQVVVLINYELTGPVCLANALLLVKGDHGEPAFDELQCVPPLRDKVSLRWKWPAYLGESGEFNEQIRIRRGNQDRQIFSADRIAYDVAQQMKSFIQKKAGCMCKPEHQRWKLGESRDELGLKNIYLTKILRVSVGSIQPVFRIKRF